MSQSEAAGAAEMLPPALRRAWGARAPRGARGRRASLDIDTIVVRAVELADAGGVSALSLVRLADSLNVTPNALYRYLDSREELDILLREYALANPPSAAPHDDWQAAARDWAHQLRARYVAHPWLADLGLTVPITPNALGWLEALLVRLEGSSLGTAETIRAATLLDGYIRAQFISQRDVRAWGGNSSSQDGDLTAQVLPFIDARGYDRVAALFREGVYREPTNEIHDRDFEYGLDRILLGLSAPPRDPAS
jgi:AcrR family transcriptional regulator